jgi:L-threonate 2-dehydrogenase
MSPQPTIGIISPGDMGHAIGAVLGRHGLRVLTNLQNRSRRTAHLSAQAGMIDVDDDHILVREVDILLSILVPDQAYAFAQRIVAAARATNATFLFADCNAVAPSTVQSIERLLTSVGVDVVDVGIIGSPPRPEYAGPRLYTSGPSAQKLAILNEYGLQIRPIGPHVGQASGLKWTI